MAFIWWEESASERALRLLTGHLSKLHDVKARCIAIDNSGSCPTEIEGVQVIQGDNSLHEFSGWQRAVDLHRRDPPDLWIFANERFPAYPVPYVESLSGPVLRFVQSTSGLWGKIDRFPTPTFSFGLEINSWITTCFFVISNSALQRLGGLVSLSEEDFDALVPLEFPSGSGFFNPGAPVDPQHARYLQNWLSPEEPTALSDRWRGAAAGAGAWPSTRAKLRSVLNEQLLSARARSQGSPLLPWRITRSLVRVSNLGAVPRSTAELLTRQFPKLPEIGDLAIERRRP
ncbi:MAG TPA: hypothetical protein VMZ51_00605 [Acidimicrobiales bacterium]|nr:hypothetical protein [Acidimicrobiales bacterium]